MLSNSTLSITWLPPDIEEERREFFTHPAKQEWYRLHCVTWEMITSGFGSGTLMPYPRSGRLGGICVSNSYHTYEDYQTYLARAKRGYRKHYSRMEDDLQYNGSLNIKAPIILCCGADGLLFSGYRRLCLAWNYGMIPYVWLVELSGSHAISEKVHSA